MRAPKIYNATQKIYAGWNLIGYPWDSMIIEYVFSTKLDHLNKMFVYYMPEWRSWVYNRSVILNGFSKVVPGYGIWVEAKQDRNWTIHNGTIN